MNPEVLD